MPTAIAHAPPFTVPGSSTNTALVRWSGTGGNQILDSAILVSNAGVVTGVTSLQVDNLNINGNTISSTAGTDLLITPLGGQQIVLDGTIIIDAGVVTGATSITSTEFHGGGGNLTGIAAGPSQATQSAIEAETNEDTYLPPDLVKNSPGVAKAWSRTGAWPGSGSNFSISDSYNVVSIADNGAGLFTHTWDTDFASANTYVNGGWGSEGRIIGAVSNSAAAVGSSQNTATIHEGTRTDVDPIMFVAFGDQ